jgi:hypothetical protein
MVDAPFWQVDKSEFDRGNYRPEALDRNLAFASATVDLDLPFNSFTHISYATRQLYNNKIDYTFGPKHQLAGLGGLTYYIGKLNVTVTAAVGGQYRSSVNRYQDGSGDDDKVILESFLSFDLKKFRFFWNYTNLLDTRYSINGRLQPGRSLWWGFTWGFVD